MWITYTSSLLYKTKTERENKSEEKKGQPNMFVQWSLWQIIIVFILVSEAEYLSTFLCCKINVLLGFELSFHYLMWRC